MSTQEFHIKFNYTALHPGFIALGQCFITLLNG